MPNLNKVLLMGNITRDIETKYTPKGTAICDFGIAVNRTFTSEAGEKREEVTFVDCEAFGRVAEIIIQYCAKGRPIFVEGRLKLEQWDDKQTGAKRSRMKVIVETIQLLGSRESGGDQTEKPKPPSTKQPVGRDRGRPSDPDLDPIADDIIF